ncbi:hypothetical protein COCMIDRAFT_41430 [Bipolaris oryzae ATCC 44560]|uniref:Uncharacterized protein n=1 Tax=Bipolaris oryzae ATCC 44560 TaxID=930090 RepID=W6Z958_COCMI|nr:uncharacterized protein COCMIDRAFT_41430 [Bipolaris oryzae ATCC 44560]EUC40211.1 hypothetical protein COCMIDRAFT_41430 [Bipolaris oryzae ATCC 44560]
MAPMPCGGRVGSFATNVEQALFAFAASSLRDRSTKLLGILQARAQDWPRQGVDRLREGLVCCQRHISGYHGRFENRRGAMIRACAADDGQSCRWSVLLDQVGLALPLALLEKPLSAGFLGRRLPGGQGGRAIM